MEFDIINITQEEYAELPVVSVRMLRTAQQKKNELTIKFSNEFKTFKRIFYTNGMANSSLVADKKAELDAEYLRQVSVLKDNLIYNMALNEPNDGGDVGGDGGDESAGYIVDYTLPYSERYALVRDYYMAIEDKNERMALYTADEVAKKYLSSYYTHLYDVLYTYSK